MCICCPGPKYEYTSKGIIDRTTNNLSPLSFQKTPFCCYNYKLNYKFKPLEVIPFQSTVDNLPEITTTNESRVLYIVYCKPKYNM